MISERNGGYMKRIFKTICVVLAMTMLFACFACEKKGGTQPAHEHTYVEVAAVTPTCDKGGNIAYYKCDCGKMFTKNGDEYVEADSDDVFISAFGHVFSKSVREIESTCTKNGVKAHAYCAICGKLFIKNNGEYTPATKEETVKAKKEHVYEYEVVADKYRLAEATADAPQIFSKSCVCGGADETGANTFTFGKTLSEYTSDDPSLYTPHALTLSLYDSKNCVYGFTWNADKVTSRPVVEIKEVGNDSEVVTIGATSDEMQSYKKSDSADAEIAVNYIRANAELKTDTEYEYRVGDKYMGKYTDFVSVKTVKPDENGTWKFTHVSDSQVLGNESLGGKDSEVYYGRVLKAVSKDNLNRFIVHTGDVVEWSKYESYWRYMIDGNSSYFSTIPTMAISGNHETTYKSGNGSSETYKHFNYSIPKQSTGYGFYYSYTYGGVKFIMINTNDLLGNSMLKADQFKWLEKELSENTEKWTIVSLHNPMYSPGKWGSGPNNSIATQLTAQLSDLFAKYKVDIVLQGHDHMISKTKPLGAKSTPAKETFETVNGIKYSVNPKGVIYVMNGPAGNQKRTVEYAYEESLYDYAEGSSESSWAEFEVSGNQITVYVKNASSGSVVTQKTWGIKKAA